jgi:hypothetical protein
MGDKKPKAHTFTKNVEPQFNFLPDSEPMDYFRLFFDDELLNNIVTDKQVCKRQNCRTSAKLEVHLEVGGLMSLSS